MSKKPNCPHHKYTEEEKAFFVEFVPGHSYREIVDEFNRRFPEPITISQVKGCIGRYKLNTGRTGRFEKGNTPWSKGRGMTEEQRRLMKPTMFKKNHRPHNTLPVGTEKKLADGYWWRKLYDTPKAPQYVNWKQIHRIVWEEHNGPIPEGYYVIFKDGNRDNLDISNLACVSKRVHCQMCKQQLYRDDPKLTETGLIIAELRDAVATKRNEISDKRHKGKKE